MTPRMVILAAGEGRRLRPLTDDRPKGLIEVAGRPLVDWQIAAATRLGIREIAVVTGYRADRFGNRDVRCHHNPDYAETNMVETLWCARSEFQGELIVAYGDILYEDSVLKALLAGEASISVLIDLGWRSYWEARFTDPLSDAESLRLDGEGRIVEIGQKVSAIEEIEGQYVGLLKFRGRGIEQLEATYLELEAQEVVGRGGRPFRQMHMTDLLQAIIDTGHEIRAVPIRRKWLEIDSTSDYELAKRSVRADSSGLHIAI